MHGQQNIETIPDANREAQIIIRRQIIHPVVTVSSQGPTECYYLSYSPLIHSVLTHVVIINCDPPTSATPQRSDPLCFQDPECERTSRFSHKHKQGTRCSRQIRTRYILFISRKGRLVPSANISILYDIKMTFGITTLRTVPTFSSEMSKRTSSVFLLWWF